MTASDWTALLDLIARSAAERAALDAFLASHGGAGCDDSYKTKLLSWASEYGNTDAAAAALRVLALARAKGAPAFRDTTVRAAIRVMARATDVPVSVREKVLAATLEAAGPTSGGSLVVLEGLEDDPAIQGYVGLLAEAYMADVRSQKE
jgi:hypothetical protein